MGSTIVRGVQTNDRESTQSASGLYQTDFVLWTQTQAQKIRAVADRLPKDMDAENIATEIEDLGKRDFRSLQSHSITALEHILKVLWSTRREPIAGWLTTIRRHHHEIQMLIEDSPSLSGKLEGKWSEIVHHAVITAAEAYQLAGEKPPSGEFVAPELTCREFLDVQFSAVNWIIYSRKTLGWGDLGNVTSAKSQSEK